MKAEPRIVLWVIAASVIFGLVAQYVLYSHSVGFNLGVLCVLAAVILVALKRMKIIDPEPSVWYLVATFLVVGYGFCIPDSRDLVLLNGFVGFASVGYYCLRVCNRKQPELVDSVVKAPVLGMGFPFVGFYASSLADWKSLKFPRKSVNFRAIVLGVLCALPVLALFGGILGQADPIFARLMSPGVSVDAENFMPRLMTFMLVSFGLFGGLTYLSSSMFDALMRSIGNGSINNSSPGPSLSPVIDEKDRRESDGFTVFMTVFGLISVLFALFIAYQVRYLFGGGSVAWAAQGMTYAEYSKRGFLEIAVVEMVCLPLLVFSQNAIRSFAPDIRKWVNLQIMGLVILLALLLASGAYRLGLYVLDFGFTTLRFYVAVGMVWMVTLLFATWRFGTRWQFQRMGSFLYASMIAITLGTNLLGPDYWIVRVSLTRPNLSNLDPDVITWAGADAYSAIRQFDQPSRKIDGKTRKLLNEYLDYQQKRSHDWRDMTLSQYRLPKKK